MLTNDQDARDQLLRLFLPRGTPPWSIDDVMREFKVGRNRADLRFEASDSTGSETAVLVETKVNDAFNESQIRTYCSTPAEVVIYAPGLTGLLQAENDPIDRERWVTGKQLSDVLSEHDQLPYLLRSYLQEVAVQADRMAAAREAARGGRDFDRTDDITEVSADDIEAVAWVAEAAAAMRALGADDVRARNTAHDYGIFWGGSWRPVPGRRGACVFGEVVAGHGGNEYTLTIKVSDGPVEARHEICNTAIRMGEPAADWKPGRLLSANTFRIWRYNAINMTAPEAATAIIAVDDYLEALVEAASV